MTQAPRRSKEDLRQKRTRRLLVQALISLLEEQSFASLSVVDICQRAMVHRTTFYAHFEDKQALLHYAIESILQEFEISASSPSLSPHDFFLSVAHSALVFLSQHRSLFQVGLGAQEHFGAPALESTLSQRISQRMSQHLTQPSFQTVLGGLDPEITAHFYAGAMVSLVYWWVEHDMPVTEEVLVRHLDRFLPGRSGCMEEG